VSTPLVLIVDDEKGLLTLFERLVAQLGCDVMKTDNGRGALHILYGETPDLLILDLAMPEISGFEVLRFVAEEPRLDTMRVMILTAAGPGQAPEDINGRIDSWITKPVLPTDFMQQVRAMLEPIV
jgi:CheY-like chemotaxis protein